MRTYTKNYDGEITPQILDSQKQSCPECGQTMSVAIGCSEWSDNQVKTENMVRIQNVPGYYCQKKCGVFITSHQVNLRVVKEVLHIANSYQLTSIWDSAYNLELYLKKHKRGKIKRTKNPPKDIQSW